MPASLHRSLVRFDPSDGTPEAYDLFAIGQGDRYLFFGHDSDQVFSMQTEQHFQDDDHRQRLLDALVPIVDTD